MNIIKHLTIVHFHKLFLTFGPQCDYTANVSKSQLDELNKSIVQEREKDVCLYVHIVSIGSLIMSNKQLIDIPDARQPRKGNKSDKPLPNIFYLCNQGPYPHHRPLNSPLAPTRVEQRQHTTCQVWRQKTNLHLSQLQNL